MNAVIDLLIAIRDYDPLLREEAQELIGKEWIKETGLKIGDKVIVTHKAETASNGWQNSWVAMDGAIGKGFEILRFDHRFGVLLSFGCYYFPWFVLKKVGDED